MLKVNESNEIHTLMLTEVGLLPAEKLLSQRKKSLKKIEFSVNLRANISFYRVAHNGFLLVFHLSFFLNNWRIFFCCKKFSCVLNTIEKRNADANDYKK